VPLLGLAVASGVVGLTCLAVLAVVASIKNVDTLSTVALALAVIAFVAQLIVFVVQAGAANTQMLQSRQLHAELLQLLGEMGERARGTQAAVTVINERLLEAALGKAIFETRAAGLRPDVPEIARDVTSALEQEAGGARSGESSRWLPRRADPNDAAIIRMLQSFPEGEAAEAALARLELLLPSEMRILKTLAEDEVSSRSPGSVFDPGLTGTLAPSDTLRVEGLVTQLSDAGATGQSIIVLTDVGRQAARLLVAEGEPPSNIAGAVRQLRAAVREEEEEARRHMSVLAPEEQDVQVLDEVEDQEQRDP
jgi:hypothetical protein